jgi:hypothetical protein
MTEKDRLNLAQAYMNAWNAVKQNHCVVNPLPHGWFEVRKAPLVDKVRAGRLLEGLVRLTANTAP